MQVLRWLGPMVALLALGLLVTGVFAERGSVDDFTTRITDELRTLNPAAAEAGYRAVL